MTITPERLATPEEMAAITSTELVPVTKTSQVRDQAKTKLARTWARQKKRATKGHGVWGDTLLSLTVLRQCVHGAAHDRTNPLATFGEYAFGYLSLLVTSTGYGLLRLLDAPLYRDWDGVPPTLSQLFNAVRTRGWLGKIYGTALIFTHAVAYGLLWIVQLPDRTALAGYTVAAYLVATWLL